MRNPDLVEVDQRKHSQGNSFFGSTFLGGTTMTSTPTHNDTCRRPEVPDGSPRDQALRGLEIPFDLCQVQWRVTEWSDDGTRGLMMPYADPRAYSDRLNDLFTPGGWTRKYSVQTSAPVQRNHARPAVWSPQQIRETAVVEQVLAQMQGAVRGMARLEAARARLAPEIVERIVVSLNAPPAKLEDLQTLHSLVVALEKEVEAQAQR